MAYQIPIAIRSETLELRSVDKYLTIGDIYFAFEVFIRNKTFYPELLLKYLLWIASVRPFLDQYNFKYLIQYCEYSAYSSLRKLFLNRYGIGLTNISHGEEFISCRSAFSSFDQYFAWDLTPSSIHDAMYIEYGERSTFNPCSDFNLAPHNDGVKVVGVLWPDNKDCNLDELTFQLNDIANEFIVIVRAHPNIANQNRINRYKPLLNAKTSNALEEDIHIFIDKCSIIIGYLSAALLQASFRGRAVIYLDNPQLKSLASYHDYYRKVKCVRLENLSSNVISHLNLS